MILHAVWDDFECSMIVRKKPEKDLTVEEAIAKGGMVKEDLRQPPPTSKARVGVTGYIPHDMLQEIHAAMEHRPGMSRNTWILEAIREKLDREKDDG